MTFSNRQEVRAGSRPASVTRAARWPVVSPDAALAGLLAVLVLGVYLHAVRFGLIWDDPLWFQQGAGQSPWEIVTALRSYQFYRPLAILLNRSLVSPAGIVNVSAAHLIQIGAHLGSTLLCVPVLRALGLTARHARLTAVVFALHPLSYQAVAWQSPQQPLATLGVLTALACAARAYRGRAAGWLALSVLAYAAALLIQESALPFVFAFFWLAMVQWPQRGRLRWWWPIFHLLLASLYAAVWITMPRLGGVTGAGFQPNVLGYILQALVFPAAALANGLVPGLAQWPLSGLVGLYTAVAALLALAAARWTSARATLLCLAWAGAGLLPVWAGLSWDYVQIGERLMYPAALGIAGLWAAPMLWLLAPATPAWRRALGGLVLVVVLGVSLWQLQQLQHLYTLGTRHLAAAERVLSAAPGGRVLFVNFPDRLALRPAPYAVGYWGLTLAPVVQDLAGFARSASGQSAEDRSLSAFLVGAGEREQWPYRVDMRGEDTPPEALWSAAQWAEQVYLTDYGPQGTLDLRPVGDVQPVPAETEDNALATLEGGAALLGAEVVQAAGQPPRLQLLWHSPTPQALDTTIFVHVWQGAAYVGGADGDSLGGLLPPAAWQPDGAVLDLRPLPAGLPAGEYTVSVGMYRRWDGTRLAAFAPDGQRLPDDEIFVATLSVP